MIFKKEKKIMKKFDDVRNEQKEDNELLSFILEMVGKLMATRMSRGLSQRELSKLAGVPQKTISRIENGLDSPKIKTIGKLASALNLKMVLVEKEEK